MLWTNRRYVVNNHSVIKLICKYKNYGNVLLDVDEVNILRTVKQ